MMPASGLLGRLRSPEFKCLVLYLDAEAMLEMGERSQHIKGA